MSTCEYSLKSGERVEFELQTKELAKDIVKTLVEERKRQGITQQNIADVTGMKTSNVTRVESCKNTPTLDVLVRYANALGKRLHFEMLDVVKINSVEENGTER